MPPVTFTWTGVPDAAGGEAKYTVDDASMSFVLPDFKTANSIYFLLQRAERAGKSKALQSAKREVVLALNQLESKSI